MNSSGQRIGP